MTHAPETHHEQHRVLSIRGKGLCNSACIFCFEQHSPVAPKADETHRLIVEGRDKYNMLFFMSGEPTLHPKLFEYVSLARANGYRWFGMSSHFRTFADPRFALRVLDAGFTFFDISLHAASYESQQDVNPIDDGGRSLREALHGLRNLLSVARRTGRRIEVTHKIVITRLNLDDLPRIVALTYDLGVRSFILQPVRVSGLEGDVARRLAVNEDEFMPRVNDLLRLTEGWGASVKLYGMSQIGVVDAPHLVQETNVIRHAHSTKYDKRVHLGVLYSDPLVPARLPSASAVAHRVSLKLPTGESRSFECKEDQFVLNAALASGMPLPFGCRMGSCGACCGQVVQGRVEHAPQLVLSDEQLGRGLVLLCRARPRSDVVVLTHQERKLEL